MLPNRPFSRNDCVKRPAGTVTRQLRHIERFGYNSLPGKSGIAMD